MASQNWDLFSKNCYIHTQSGLKIYTLEPKNDFLCRINVCVRTPVKDDFGAPHALEHLIFFGSQKNPYKGFLDEFAVNHLCSEINATTSSDYTNYSFSGLSTSRKWIEKVIQSLIEQLLTPALPEDAFHSEVYSSQSKTGVMYLELVDREFDIKLNSMLEAKKVLYENMAHFNCNAAGNAKHLRNGSLTLNDVQKYHEENYQPANMAIFIHGYLDMDFLMDSLEQLLSDFHPLPKLNIPRNTIQADTLKEMTLASANPDLILTCSWEILNADLNATKVLLEFFKKNHSVLFSNFTYDLEILGQDHAYVSVLFEDFEELDEAKMAMKMKKSIAEYMNQVGKESFVECLQNALNLTQIRAMLDLETNPHENDFKDALNHFLYGLECENMQKILEDLKSQDFQFWFNVAKRWARAPWAVLVTTGSPDLYEKEMKQIKQPLSIGRKMPIFQDFELSSNALNTEEIQQLFRKSTELCQENKSAFSLLLFAYDLSSLSLEDLDFIPMIEYLLAKSIRSTSQVIKVKVTRIQRYLFMFLTVLNDQAQKTLNEILDHDFMDECEDMLGKVAKAVLGNLSTFDHEDIHFWRVFLRFKHYLKLLKSLSNYEEKATKKTEKILDIILAKIAKIQIFSSQEEVKEKCQHLIEKVNLIKKQKEYQNYGHGHHRINVSDVIQSSQACIMMPIPKEMSNAEAAILTEMLNKSGKGILWQNIRDQGLAYAVSLHLDRNNSEFVILIQDSGDVIKALAAVRQTIEDFSTLKLSEKDIELAKKNAFFKHLKRQEITLIQVQNDFIAEILNQSSNPQNILSVSDCSRAQKLFVKDYLNPKKLNMVVMIPKTTLTKMQTLKGLLSHGFKLFT